MSPMDFFMFVGLLFLGAIITLACIASEIAAMYGYCDELCGESGNCVGTCDVYRIRYMLCENCSDIHNTYNIHNAYGARDARIVHSTHSLRVECECDACNSQLEREE